MSERNRVWRIDVGNKRSQSVIVYNGNSSRFNYGVQRVKKVRRNETHFGNVTDEENPKDISRTNVKDDEQLPKDYSCEYFLLLTRGSNV